MKLSANVALNASFACVKPAHMIGPSWYLWLQWTRVYLIIWQTLAKELEQQMILLHCEEVVVVWDLSIAVSVHLPHDDICSRPKQVQDWSEQLDSVLNPDLLSSSRTGINPGKRSWKSNSLIELDVRELFVVSFHREVKGWDYETCFRVWLLWFWQNQTTA